nr:hypothetical protein [Tanacetum cinerariifolium]
MSNMSKDIQYAGFDTRPPMLDRTDFESWQERIRLFCLGKDNGENIMNSITKGSFRWERSKKLFSAAHLGPECDRVFTDLSADEKKRYKADIRATNILLQGSELTKDDRESQLYNEFEHFRQIKGSTSTYNLIESLTNTLALLTQSYKSYLPQTNNQLRTSFNARNKATVQYDKVVVQDVRGRYNGIIKEDHFRGTMQEELLELGMRERPQDSDYFKDMMLLMQAQENGAVLDEDQLLFFVGEQVTNFDDDVDDPPEQDLALNVYHVFEADQCDAFDFDVDEVPTTHTMFMANLSSKDLIYNEVGPSYDSNTSFEVQYHDNFIDNVDEYHELHEMQNDVQHNYAVDSDAEYTSDSNIISYDWYVEENEENVVQSNVSSIQNEALMSIIDEMHEQGVHSRSVNKQDKVVNDSLTSKLARYKELVGVYEQQEKFELTEREQKIDEQMRIIISDRNRKETSLKLELHYVQMQLCSTLDHYKSMTEEVTILKKDFKQKEDKHLKEFLDMKKLKDKVKDRLFKQDQSIQTVHMLCRPKPFYDEKKKVAIGYKNPLCPTRAKQVQSALYNGNEIVRTNHAPAVVYDSEDTLKIAEITRNKMFKKMNSPLCVKNKVKFAPLDYSKDNYLAIFAPQRDLTP